MSGLIRGVLCRAASALLLTALCAPLAHASEGSQWLVREQTSLRYRIDGDGPKTVVLLQESAVPLEVWDEILPLLADPRYSFLRYDPRGVGLSEKIRFPASMDEYVDDLHALLAAQQVTSPVVLIGGAFGGSIALQFAARYPEQVAAVAVTSPSAMLEPRQPRARINPIDDPAGAQAMEERTWNVVYPVELRADERRWHRYVGMASAVDFESDVLTERLINLTPFAEVLPRIQCPTLYVATTLFPRPVDSVRVLADVTPKGEFVEVRTGHLASYQSPELIAPILSDFLNRHVR